MIVKRPYQLERQQWIPHPRSEVFDFFSRAENLERLTPRWLGFQILTPLPLEMAEGAIIEYTIRLGGLPVRWRTRILEWKPPHHFKDEQERGPYASWVHTHSFEERDGGTLMTDRVRYRLPFDPIGRMAHAPLVRPSVNAIFDFRYDRVREIFAGAGNGPSEEGNRDHRLAVSH